MKRSELKQLIKEEILKETDEFEKFQSNFEKFTKELTKLSKKYGIAINSVGGVSYGDIKNIVYDDDLSSGDLEYKINWK